MLKDNSWSVSGLGTEPVLRLYAESDSPKNFRRS